MEKKTVAIIGGSQEQTYKQIGKKLGCNILFHNGKTKNNRTRNLFRPIVRKADCVVMLTGALGHIPMEIVKELCKEHDIKFIDQASRGASGAINKALDALKQQEAV